MITPGSIRLATIYSTPTERLCVAWGHHDGIPRMYLHLWHPTPDGWMPDEESLHPLPLDADRNMDDVAFEVIAYLREAMRNHMSRPRPCDSRRAKRRHCA